MNLYFNRTFSAVSYAMADLRELWRHDDLHIHVSHSVKDPYLVEQADTFTVEPKDASQEKYLRFILEQCEKYKIDAFVPRSRARKLRPHAAAFEEAGVKVMWVCDADTYALLDHKTKSAQLMKERGIVAVPTSFFVTNYEEFEQAYNHIREQGDTVCFKPNEGIGGRGFRIIQEKGTPYEYLFREHPTKVPKSVAFEALKSKESFSPLIVSTYLNGREYSVDCLADKGELITAIPRHYVSKHYQDFIHVPELIELCRVLAKELNLSYVFNAQFRRHRDQWHFIEINTRMAAGMHRTQLVGAHLLHDAVDLLVNERRPQARQIDWGAKVFKRISFELEAPSSGSSDGSVATSTDELG